MTQRIQKIFNKEQVPNGYKRNTLGVFPIEWKLKKLQDVGKISTGATPLRSNQQYFEGDIYWVKTTDLNNSYITDTEEKITEVALKETSVKIVKENSILIAMYGGFNQIGRTGLMRISGATNQAISSFFIDEKEYHAEYILHWLNTYRPYWKRLAGSSRKDPNITKKDVEDFPIMKPLYEEQKKIASIISTWDKAIELKEKLIEQKKEQKKELMQKLLTGEVRLPGFEGEWREVNLAKVSKRIKGKAVEYLENGKFPAIDMDYLESGLFKNFSNDATVFAKKNDVLLLWDGSRAGMAFTGVEGAVGSTFVKLECKSIDNIFLQKHLEMNERKIQRLREGSGIPHVPKDFLNFYKIKMPSMDEQKAISNVLNNMDKNLEFLQKEIVYLKQQKQGLMQQLLTGKIRVKV